MILGPFWCQRDLAWVRFNIENGNASAEISHTSQENPLITTAWQSVENGFWPTSYAYGEEEVLQVFYSLQENGLYKTEGQVNQWSGQFNAGHYRDGNWAQYNILAGMKEKNGFNPFTNYQQDDVQLLTPYPQLPLTPEMVADKLEKERALEEERIRRAAEEVRIQQENERVKWEDFKKRELRSRGLQEAGRDTLFDQEGALNLLLNECNKALLGFEARNYDNCAAYLQELKTVIEDYNDPRHKELISTASKTDIDRDLGLADDEQLRRILFEHKKDILFNLLRAEVAYLSHEFNIACDLLSPEVIEERTEAQKALEARLLQEEQEFIDDFEPGDIAWPQNDLQDYDYHVPPPQPAANHPQDDFDPAEIQQAIDESFEENQEQFFRPHNQAGDPAREQQELQAVIEASRREAERAEQERARLEQEQVQRVIAQSLVDNPVARRQANILDDEPAQLLQIQRAVNQAQARYKEWYDDESGVKEIRGRDGFFSRWFFRHGSSGQRCANDFKNAINLETITELEAINQVNHLLQDRNTAYNRHSFASFLLDELRLIEDSPWRGIISNASNLYDKDAVINALGLGAPALNY